MSIWAQDTLGLPDPPQPPPLGSLSNTSIQSDSNANINEPDPPMPPWNDSNRPAWIPNPNWQNNSAARPNLTYVAGTSGGFGSVPDLVNNGTVQNVTAPNEVGNQTFPFAVAESSSVTKRGWVWLCSKLSLSG